MNDPKATIAIRDGGFSPVPEHAWPRIAARLNLTERETSIIRGLFQRMNEAAIGESLGISHHTVHTHLNRVYRKLSVQSRGELFLRVVKECMG